MKLEKIFFKVEHLFEAVWVCKWIFLKAKIPSEMEVAPRWGAEGDRATDMADGGEGDEGA